MNIDQLAFAESFSGLGAVSSYLSTEARKKLFRDYMSNQQKYADKNHKGNLKKQVEAGFRYVQDPKAPSRMNGFDGLYYKSIGWNADKVMMDLKELRPDLFKPEYLPSAVTPAKINSPAVPAVASGGGSFMENMKGYATPKNIAIAAAGAGLIYWFVIRK
ncbi:hypothetical protein [Catalinimonas niigatensis]|uniref:hypothetical protein n=1 Tax=Catalinimonas niigatensis TaxID=1397264 RepID=UPI002666B81A|nr:hypothetical protein [Catalinimonas niigatensis]WPP49627.1 hypothetical protein PZB72_23415 [Catalinimonas niigatensis]